MVSSAILDVTLNVSPILSLSDPEAQIDVNLSVKIAESKRAGRPITFLAHRSIFEVDPITPYFDVFARGLYTALNSVDGPEARSIRLNPCVRVREGLNHDEPDLRKRGVSFFTIPGDPSQEAVFHHPITWERLFRNAKRGPQGLKI